MADQSVSIVFRALYQSKLGGLQRDIDRIGASASRAATQAGTGMSALGKASQVAGTALMVGVGAALAVGIKAAIDFESSFAGVRKTVEASESEFQALSDAIREMSTEIPVSVHELSQIAELGGQLGVPVEALGQFTDVIAKMAATTNLEIDDAATQFARFSNVMGTGLHDFDNMGSAVVDLGNKFASTEKEILTFATRLSGIGAAVGFTEQEVLGLATAFTSLGEPAERGASALQNTFIKIQQFATGGGPKLQAFADLIGMSTQQAADLIKEDLLGAFVAMEEGLGGIMDSGGDANVVLKDLGLNAIRTTTLLLKGAAGVDVVTDALKVANSSWEANVAMNVEADKRFSTTTSQLKLLANEVYDARIAFGENFLPAVKDVIQTLRGFFGVVADNLPVLKGLAVLVTTLAVGRGFNALATALGNAMVSMRTFGTATITTAEGLKKVRVDAPMRSMNSAGGALLSTTSRLKTGLQAFAGILGVTAIALGFVAVAMANAKARTREFEAAVADLMDLAVLLSDDKGAKFDFATDPEILEGVMTAIEKGTFGIGTMDLNRARDALTDIGMSFKDVSAAVLLSEEDFEAWRETVLKSYDDAAQATVEGGQKITNEEIVRMRALEFFLNRVAQVRAEHAAEEERRRKESTSGFDWQGDRKGRGFKAPPATSQSQMQKIIDRALTDEQALLDAIQLELGPEGNADEVYGDIIEGVTEFGQDFNQAWDDIVSGFSETFQGWQSTWEGYEQVPALSISKLKKALKAWNADSQRLLAANTFVAQNFSLDQQAVWAALPEDLRRAAAALLAEGGADDFAGALETLFGQVEVSSGDAMEATMLEVPRKAMEAVEKEWPAFFAESLTHLPDAVIANPELMKTHTKEMWDAWFGSQDPMIQQGIQDLADAALVGLVEADIDMPADWMAFGPEQATWWSEQGLSWGLAVAAGFLSADLAGKLAHYVTGAAVGAKNAFDVNWRLSSPSKVAQYQGLMIGKGWVMGAAKGMEGFNDLLVPTMQAQSRPMPAPIKVSMPAQDGGPTIQVYYPEHKDDDVIDGVKKGLALSGLVRIAESVTASG